MSILSTEQLGHSFTGAWLFKNLYLGLEKGDRVSLVGINGTGKSTLLRILTGLFSPTEGKVVTERNLRIGYLEQDPRFDENMTINNFIYSMDNIQQQLIREYETCIHSQNVDEKRLSYLMDELNNRSAWEYEFEIKTILGRLGITYLEQQISTLSGGQRKRVAMAKLLIDDPDVYLLDEPTNHLDIETIEWLENFLTKGQKTILFVTHDRYFLDHVSNQIFELDQGKLLTYQGNYAYYLEKKAALVAAEDTAFEKNSNLLRSELEWMRRQPKARTTKSKSKIDAFHTLEEKVQKQVKSSLVLGVQSARQGNKILELKAVNKAFDTLKILTDFSYTFKKGDRIGIVGKNGTGKSTFLNLITGNLKPDLGLVDLGETTVFGYYKQGGLEFEPKEQVLDVVKNVAEYITMADGKTLTASQVLTHFLFPPAKQYGMVHQLSGGEKKRLQLMRVLIRNPNFLILDEPTNDLDIDTLNVLESFLLNFPGVLLLVSHDRYLVDRLTDQLFIFEGNSKICVYPGNYTDYRLEQEQLVAISKSTAPATAEKLKKQSSFKEEKKRESLENEIQVLESTLLKLTETLNAETLDHNQLMTISNQIELLTQELDKKTQEWINLE